jgi:hypothetical protein
MPSKIRLSGVDRKAIAERLMADIDSFCVQHYPNEHRDHLGTSEIGERCARKLWYIFRWMHREQFLDKDAKMLRLFNRGHQTENRFAEWMRGIGMKVWLHADDGKQFHIDGAEKHFGGGLDGVALLPENYGINAPFLTEFKTHNLKHFTKLMKDGVCTSHPKHFAQMNTYGADAMYDFDYAIYFALCKNDDRIYIEVVSLDKEAGRNNVKKAEQIIFSQTPPGRIAASAAYAECAYCPMRGICHSSDPVDKNCRSCLHATPIADMQWKCNRHKITLPKETILTGCRDWQELEHRS